MKCNKCSLKVFEMRKIDREIKVFLLDDEVATLKKKEKEAVGSYLICVKCNNCAIGD